MQSVQHGAGQPKGQRDDGGGQQNAGRTRVRPAVIQLIGAPDHKGEAGNAHPVVARHEMACDQE